MAKAKNFKGFTLIEILVVVALIAILTAITFIAINPAKNFKDTRNAQRSSDVTQILNAATQYLTKQGASVADFDVDGGVAVPTCPAGDVYIGPAAALEADAEFVALEEVLVEDYIVGIPLDPSFSAVDATEGYGYQICQVGESGRIQIDAPNAEDKPISVKR